MNLQAFIATGERVPNIRAALHFIDGCLPDGPGVVYDGDCYIEDNGTTATLTIYSDSWSMPSHLIGDLEAILYQWAVGEGIIDDDASEAQREGTAAAAAIIEWTRANGEGQAMSLALIANASRGNAGVCHLQDVCDAWSFIGEDCSEDALDDAYTIMRAELMLQAGRLY